MGGPFAAYFYAAYSPLLTWTQSSPHLVWLTDFFAPHLTTPSSWWLSGLVILAKLLLPLGLLSFILHASYLYWIKFRRNGIATGLAYRYVRHPQYTSLGIAGLGLVFLWPRFLTLAMFLAMLVGYQALARAEEKRMERSHGERYRAYTDGLPAFSPGGVGGRALRWLFGWSASARLRTLLGWSAALGFAVIGSVLLRAASVAELAVENAPGSERGVILFLESPTGLDATTVWQKLGNPNSRDDGLPLFYVVATRETLLHLLVDSGVRVEGLREAIPEAPWYVLETAALVSRCPNHACEPRDTLQEALGAQTLRRVKELHYLGTEDADELITWSLTTSALHSHSAAPVL